MPAPRTARAARRTGPNARTERRARPRQYEPELFPGLIYRMVQPKIVLLIFVSGKVVLTGAREMPAMRAAYASACADVFCHYRREGEDTNSSTYHAQLATQAFTSHEAQAASINLA